MLNKDDGCMKEYDMPFIKLYTYKWIILYYVIFNLVHYLHVYSQSYVVICQCNEYGKGTLGDDSLAEHLPRRHEAANLVASTTPHHVRSGKTPGWDPWKYNQSVVNFDHFSSSSKNGRERANTTNIFVRTCWPL